MNIDLTDEEAGVVIKALGIHRAAQIRKLERISPRDTAAIAATNNDIILAGSVLSDLMEIQDEERTKT